MNPAFVVESIQHNGKNINIIQDSHITGGTKSRGIYPFIQNNNQYKEFVYAGPAIGYAQYALAFCGQQLGKKVTIFISSVLKKPTTPTRKAIRCGARIIKCTYLSDAQEKAKNYCEQDSNRFLCPFGMDSPDFNEILYQHCLAANPPNIGGGRIWVTVGSGTLLRVLMQIYPDAEFVGVIVGKKVWEDQFEPRDWRRLTLYTSELKFNWEIRNQCDIPPYDSLLTYDAKLWAFAKNHIRDGDYIFNVAGNE